jgi:hypothetical protein
MFKNGNRTHDNLEKWVSNPWICVKMGIEPMNCLCGDLEQKSLFPKFSFEHMWKSVYWNQTMVQGLELKTVDFESKPSQSLLKGLEPMNMFERLKSNLYQSVGMGM